MTQKEHKIVLTQHSLYEYICYLIDNIYISVGSFVFRQKIGIPMGTDCAPFLANLYLYALEFDYLAKLNKSNPFEARKFSKCFRYIDDLLCFNNNNLVMEKVHEIYPPELVLKKTNPNDQSCTFLHWCQDRSFDSHNTLR